ncbi:hypothetical protein [Micropruina sp.]|uniref:hypothetical protein n=1 Tax=Micropruina sp. TaxID=2737536 RepID=UPI0039E4F576
MSGLISSRRRRRLFAAPVHGRRPIPRWSWAPFAVLAGGLALLTALRALGLDGPQWYLWLTDPRQPFVPAVFLGSIVAAAALYGRSRNAAGRVVGVISVSAFAVAAVLLGLVSYLHCSTDGPPFFDQLIWVLSGNGADPWGSAPGCPVQPPLAHHLARLCALWGALASVLGVVAAMLRRQLDRWLAARADRAIVVLGASEQAAAMVRAVAADRSPSTALLVVDHTGDEAFAATVRSMGGRVVAAEGVDADLLRSLLTRRGRIAVETVQIIEERVPEALSTFAQIAKVLDGAEPNPALVSRVQLRIDDPWAAENWRRTVTGTDRTWLADALSATEQTARALVARLDRVQAERLVLAGRGDLAAAVLAELARAERQRRVLRVDRTAARLQVTVVDEGAAEFVAEHTAQQARFGNDPGLAEVKVVARPATDAVLIAEAAGELNTVLVIADDGPELNRPTRLAGQLPRVTILAVDPASSEFPDQPLVGRLTSFGVGLLSGDEPPEDHWTRIARLLHAAYLGQLGDAVGSRPSSRPWAELPTFYRQSNLRQVHTLLTGVAQLGRTWAAEGAGEELSAAEIDFLSRAEHESWRRFHTAHGWRPGPRRDDSRLVHDWLVDWDALPPAARMRTIAGVRRSLALLDTAGYRSQRMRTLAPFRRRGEVRATRLSETHHWRTESGAEMTGVAGDWLVTDPDTGRQWTADQRAFASGHERIEGDRYRRTGTVLARPAHLGEHVDTIEGPALGQPGEWLVQGSLDERWLVPTARFRAAYEPV